MKSVVLLVVVASFAVAQDNLSPGQIGRGHEVDIVEDAEAKGYGTGDYFDEMDDAESREIHSDDTQKAAKELLLEDQEITDQEVEDPTTTDEECVDKEDSATCEQAKTFCTRSIMLKKDCKKTCGICKEKCVDRLGSATCEQYKTSCKNDNYFANGCKKTCGACKLQEPLCTFESGVGSGVPIKLDERVTGEQACAEACNELRIRPSHSSYYKEINGASVRPYGRFGLLDCECELNMKSVIASDTYRTCFLTTRSKRDEPESEAPHADPVVEEKCVDKLGCATCELYKTSCKSDMMCEDFETFCKNNKYIANGCKKTCGACKEKCVDKLGCATCEKIAGKTSCKSSIMIANGCKKTCGACSPPKE